MIVAVVTVCMVQVTVNKIVHVIPVGNGLVAAIGAMLMLSRGMVTARMLGCTGVGIPARDAHGMFIIMPFMLVVHVTALQVVGVPFVLNRRMAAPGAMGMIVVTVNFVIISHGLCLLFGLCERVMRLSRQVKHSGQHADEVPVCK